MLMWGYGVKAITDGAFMYCTNLTSIYIPITCQRFDRYVFSDCPLENIYYGGKESQWNSITDLSRAGIRAAATIHYNSTP